MCDPHIVLSLGILRVRFRYVCKVTCHLEIFLVQGLSKKRKTLFNYLSNHMNMRKSYENDEVVTKIRDLLFIEELFFPFRIGLFQKYLMSHEIIVCGIPRYYFNFKAV